MLHFITGNQHKIEIARHELDKYQIKFVPHTLDLTEIQSDSIEKIAEYKAKKAFGSVQKPLIVKDDGWLITALNGFPGAYMHYINEWFSADDFLQLMKGKKNRENILHEVVCYIDNTHIQLFTCDVKGKILNEAHGNDSANNSVTTMRSDGKTIAECRAKGEIFYDEGASDVWEQFAQWYMKTII